MHQRAKIPCLRERAFVFLRGCVGEYACVRARVGAESEWRVEEGTEGGCEADGVREDGGCQTESQGKRG